MLKLYRLLVVVEKGRTKELLALLKDFICGGPLVRLGLVIEPRELRRSIDP